GSPVAVDDNFLHDQRARFGSVGDRAGLFAAVGQDDVIAVNAGGLVTGDGGLRDGIRCRVLRKGVLAVKSVADSRAGDGSPVVDARDVGISILSLPDALPILGSPVAVDDNFLHDQRARFGSVGDCASLFGAVGQNDVIAVNAGGVVTGVGGLRDGIRCRVLRKGVLAVQVVAVFSERDGAAAIHLEAEVGGFLGSPVAVDDKFLDN